MTKNIFRTILTAVTARRRKHSTATESLKASAAATPDHLLPALVAQVDTVQHLRDMLERLGAPRNATKPYLLTGNGHSMAVVRLPVAVANTRHDLTPDKQAKATLHDDRGGAKLEILHYGKSVALYVDRGGLVAVEDLSMGTPRGPYMTAQQLLAAWGKKSPKMRKLLATALGMEPSLTPIKR